MAKEFKLNMQEKYPSCDLTVHLDEDYKINKIDFEEIKNRLELVGGTIRTNGKLLEISFDSKKFINARSRQAGRKKRYIGQPVPGNELPVFYCHLVYWHYGLGESWNEISKRVNVSKATFYRRLKHHLNTVTYERYIESIDMSKATDLKYLMSLEYGGTLFG